MNLSALYESTPEDQHGNIVVSAGAVTITQSDQTAVKLLREKAEDTAQLTDTAGEAVELVHLKLLKASLSLSNKTVK